MVLISSWYLHDLSHSLLRRNLSHWFSMPHYKIPESDKMTQTRGGKKIEQELLPHRWSLSQRGSAPAARLFRMDYYNPKFARSDGTTQQPHHQSPRHLSISAPSSPFSLPPSFVYHHHISLYLHFSRIVWTHSSRDWWWSQTPTTKVPNFRPIWSTSPASETTSRRRPSPEPYLRARTALLFALMACMLSRSPVPPSLPLANSTCEGSLSFSVSLSF